MPVKTGNSFLLSSTRRRSGTEKRLQEDLLCIPRCRVAVHTISRPDHILDGTFRFGGPIIRALMSGRSGVGRLRTMPPIWFRTPIRPSE